jgi:DNA processing protein
MAALTAGGKSIGVLGCGIDIDYPKGNAKVKRLMCENGAVITEYPLGTKPGAWNFPFRNRIVSGMCHGVVVVEADIGSGSLLTAHHALEQGRDVFAVPGSIFSKRERGTHRLIREGAKLTESAQDIFDEYEFLGFKKNVARAYKPPAQGTTSYSHHAPMGNAADENRVTRASPNAGPVKPEQLQHIPEPLEVSREKPPEEPPKPPPDLSGEAALVLSVIKAEPQTVEQIAAEALGASFAEVLSALTELEIYGLIESHPGRRFKTV